MLLGALRIASIRAAEVGVPGGMKIGLVGRQQEIPCREGTGMRFMEGAIMKTGDEEDE